MLAPERWVGYIKDYDGGTLMECAISKDVDYLSVTEMVAAQRSAILSALHAVSHEDVVYDGLVFPPPASFVSTPAAAGSQVYAATKIPGVTAANWREDDPSLVAARNATPAMLAATRAKATLRESLSRLTLLISSLEEAWPFRQPVDLKVVKDYLAFVQIPMGASKRRRRNSDRKSAFTTLLPVLPPASSLCTDFTTIARKIDAGTYPSLAAWLYDVELIISNCRKYNPPDSDMAALAAKVEAFVSGSKLRGESAWANAQGVATA
jgi:histone acetyltransferase